MIEINKLNVPAKPRSKYKNNYSSGSFSYAGSSGSNTIIEKCDLLTTTDEDEATDEVAFSSLRTEQDFLKKIDAEDKYLSKDKDDTANGVITFESGIIVKSKDNTRKVSKAISEAGVMAFGFNTDIIEEGDESDSLNSNIEEISFYSGSGATTIGELSNVDELADNITEEDVVLVKWKGTDVYVPIPLDSIASTGIKYDLQLQNNLDSRQFATQIGEPCIIDFTFISKEKVSISSAWEATGERGALEIFVKKPTDESFILVHTVMIQSDTSVKMDIIQYLGVGANSVMLRAKGEITEQTTSNLVYNIQLTSLGINANTFAWWNTFKGDNISVPYFISGNINKVLHIQITGDNDYSEYYNVNVGLGSYAETPYTYNIPAPSSDGVYSITAWVTNSDGSIKTKSISYDVVYGNSAKFICINNTIDKPKNWYENKIFDYSVTDGESTYTDAIFRVYKDTDVIYESIENNILTATKHTFILPLEIETIDESNFSITVQIKDNSESINKLINFEVENSEGYGATAGVVFQISPKSRNNNQSNYNKFINEVTGEEITANWNGFNWANDGWTTDNDGNRVLRVNTGSSIELNYKPFERECARTGKVIEFDYKLFNITNYEHNAITIGDKLTIQPDVIYAQTKNLHNEETQSIPTDNDVRLRIALVILPDAYGISGFNLCSIYINGTKNRTFNYESNDYFADASNLIIGSEYCDIDLYGVRIYNTGLGSTSILKNYINWLNSNDEKLYQTTKNDVFDAEGTSIDFEKIKQTHNVCVLDCPYPNFNDTSSRYATAEFYMIGDSDNNATITNVQIAGQGTSSMKYREWNIRVRLDRDKTKPSVITYSDGSLSSKKYRMFDNVPLTADITFKKNWASSMQDHKAGSVNTFTDAWKQLGLSNPATEADSKVRVSVYQEPFVMFYKYTNEEGVTVYQCMGEFTGGPHKGDKNCFGYDTSTYPNLISLEGCDNAPLPCLFRVPYNKEYFSWDSAGEVQMYNGEKAWEVSIGQKNLQSFIDAYNVVYLCSPRLQPFNGGLNDLNADVINYRANGTEYWIADKTNADYGNVMYYNASLGRFIYSDVGDGSINLFNQLNVSSVNTLTPTELNELFIEKRINKFRDEAPNYWNITDSLYHYNFVEFTAGTDNRAKNTYPYSFGGLFQWRQDDLDTIFPINNQGQISKAYSCETHDFYDGTKPVWNGETSNFWNLLELAFPNEIKLSTHKFLDALIKLGGKTNGLFADKLYAWYDKYYVGVKHYFPINLINNDQKRYEDAKLAQMAGTYTNDTDALTQSLGDLYSAETAWIKKRIQYMMSKYSYGEYSANGTDSINVRAAGNEIRYTITPAIDLYPNIASGTSIIRGDRTYAGEPCEIVIDLQGSADQQNIIQGASYLMDIGKWYDKYIDGNMIIKGRMLRNIELGSKTEPITIAISSLTISNTPVLKTLDVSNISTLSGSLDLGSCTGIENIYAYGTSLSQIKLPDGGVVRNIEFPESTAYLTLKNFPLIEANGVGIDLCKENITDFFVTGCDKLNSLNLLETILIAQEEQSEHNLKRIRAIGFDSTYNGSAGTLAMDRLSNLADGSYVGLDSNGLAGDDVPLPVLEGSITLNCNAYKDAIDLLKGTYPKIDFTMLGDYFIRFADSAVQNIVVNKWGGNGGITEAQMGAVTDLGWNFKANTEITQFDELKYFTGLKTLQQQRFEGCSGLKSIIIPNQISTIELRAFYAASRLGLVNLHTGITNIGDNAFAWTNSLKEEINLPNLTNLSGSAFNGSGITTVINLGKITTLNNSVFKECKSLTNVTLPNTVKSISNEAFRSCTNLTDINIPDTVTSLGYYAFNGCSSLNPILPDSITSIGEGALQRTILSGEVSLPNLTSLSRYPFGSTKITKVSNLGNITTMGDAVFEQCKNLIEVVLPKTLTSTNTFMCNGCSNLEKVTIQGNTATIGMKCFYDCKKLETVICDVSTPPSLHSDAFQASNSTFKIYVPDESVDLYKTATNWVNYASRIYPISELPVE